MQLWHALIFHMPKPYIIIYIYIYYNFTFVKFTTQLCSSADESLKDKMRLLLLLVGLLVTLYIVDFHYIFWTYFISKITDYFDQDKEGHAS